MATATLTSKGQTTVPKEVRDHLSLKPGDKLDFRIDADGQVRLSVRKRRLHELAGMLGEPARRFSLEEIDEVIAPAAREDAQGR